MIIFQQALTDWQSPLFEKSLKHEISNINPDYLPLQNATTQGGLVDATNISITILRHHEKNNSLIINIGLFFTEIVPSCNCDEEPLEANTYCEIKITINKSNAKTTFTLLESSHEPDI